MGANGTHIGCFLVFNHFAGLRNHRYVTAGYVTVVTQKQKALEKTPTEYG